MSLELTQRQNAILGVIGSSIETLINHPIHIIKNKSQYKSEFKLHPRFMYKGLFINTISLGGITAFQFYFYKHIYNITDSNFASSFASGILSGFISSPSELFIIQKFKYQNFFEMHTDLMKEHGLYKFYTRGMMNNMLRESFYTMGMLSLTPYLEKKFRRYEKHSIHHGMMASIVAGIISGTISHPFDTVKTILQFDFHKKVDNKIDYFRGYIPRIWRIITTFFIINECNQRLDVFVKNHF